MKFYILSDLHGKASLLDELSGRLAVDDVLLICGDITHFGGHSDAEKVLGPYLKVFPSIMAVGGNCDYSDVNDWLAEKGISVNRTTKTVGDYIFYGISGSTPCPGKTPYEHPESEFEAVLNNYPKEHGKKLVFVLHQPPIKTKVDVVFGGDHVGSQAVRDAIETVQPVLCVSGHIHDARNIDKLGETILVNPGQASRGLYAIYDCETEQAELKSV